MVETIAESIEKFDKEHDIQEIIILGRDGATKRMIIHKMRKEGKY